MSVGVHPQNRDGACLITQDVHELLDSISQVGFVPSRVHAVGIEIFKASERAFNEDLVQSAGGSWELRGFQVEDPESLSHAQTRIPFPFMFREHAHSAFCSRRPNGQDVLQANRFSQPEGRLHLAVPLKRKARFAETPPILTILTFLLKRILNMNHAPNMAGHLRRPEVLRLSVCLALILLY